MYREKNGRLQRQITPAGLADFEAVTASGLYQALVKENLLVSHQVLKQKSPDGSIVIAPDEIPTISYPFEWSFSMLQDAALTTLAIQKTALAHDMTLKDASAYNLQFVAGQPIFIDTLSFEPYQEGEPWVAYGQFCRHFLAPLSLMAYTDIRLSQLLRNYLDGLPLDLAAKLLPRRAKLAPSILMHIVVHAKAQTSKAKQHKKSTAKLTKKNQLAIIDGLERSIKRRKPKTSQTEWMDYYDNTNYSGKAAAAKTRLVKDLSKKVERLDSVIDMGGNDGHYSRLFSEAKIRTVCADIDPFAVEYNYRRIKKTKDSHMLPLLVDLTNPGGALGWANEERGAVHERLQADLVMALALIHHLAISNNLPFRMIAEYLSRFGDHLLIEFVPKADSQVQKLLSTRQDIFVNYTQEQFEQGFSEYYDLVTRQAISGSKRTLYLYKRKFNG